MAHAHSQSYDYEDELPRAGGRDATWSPRIPRSNGLQADNVAANGDGGVRLCWLDYCTMWLFEHRVYLQAGSTCLLGHDGEVFVTIYQETADMLLAKLGRPTEAVKKKASRMGLRKSKKYMKSLGRS
jgi:hypothetical protein